MAKLWLIGLCMFTVTSLSFAEEMKPSHLPAEVKYSGKIHSAQTFTDALGEHIVVSSTLSTPRNQHDEGASYVFVYDYLKKEGAYTLNWKLEDGVKACALDYEAVFKAKPIVSDLDQNGIKEVTMVYSQTCTGDVSPSDYKVIMREDQNKYALRGFTFDPASKGKVNQNPCCLRLNKNKEATFADGMYHDENDFKKKNIPKAFLAHAKKIWMKYR